MQHLVVARRDAGAEQDARVAVEEIVAPASAKAEAGADRLPPEARTEDRSHRGARSFRRVRFLEPQQRPLDLAAFVWFERFGLIGALLRQRSLARVLSEAHSGRESQRHRDNKRDRPTRHRPRTISQATSGVQRRRLAACGSPLAVGAFQQSNTAATPAQPSRQQRASNCERRLLHPERSQRQDASRAERGDVGGGHG